jgi:hypothetical protein
VFKGKFEAELLPLLPINTSASNHPASNTACFEVERRNGTTDEHRSTQIKTEDEKEIFGAMRSVDSVVV